MKTLIDSPQPCSPTHPVDPIQLYIQIQLILLRPADVMPSACVFHYTSSYLFSRPDLCWWCSLRSLQLSSNRRALPFIAARRRLLSDRVSRGGARDNNEEMGRRLSWYFVAHCDDGDDDSDLSETIESRSVRQYHCCQANVAKHIGYTRRVIFVWLLLRYCSLWVIIQANCFLVHNALVFIDA